MNADFADKNKINNDLNTKLNFLKIRVYMRSSAVKLLLATVFAGFAAFCA